MGSTKNRDLLPGGTRNVSLLHIVTSASYPMGNGSCLPGLDADRSPLSNAVVTNRSAVPPPCDFRVLCVINEMQR
jgi:hypothetical protein